MPSGYELTLEIPAVDDYLRLRVETGLSPKSREAAQVGLPNSLFGVVVRNGGEVIGMGRVIGDGALFFQVTDIAVLPEHQGRGIGKAIVAEIVRYLERVAMGGAYASLIADGEAHRLYAQFGFAITNGSVGMERYLMPVGTRRKISRRAD